MSDYSYLLARWMSQDPLSFDGGVSNLYEYTAGNPVSRTDPSGLFVLPPPITGCLIAAGGGLVFDLTQHLLKCKLLGCDADELCAVWCNAAGNCVAGAIIAGFPAGGWPAGCVAGAVGSVVGSICDQIFCSCDSFDICDLAALVASSVAGCYGGNVGGLDEDKQAVILFVVGMILPYAKDLCDNRDVFSPKKKSDK